MNLTTIILAAGKGTRMRSQLPKVLHHIAEKPLLKHVHDTAIQLENNTIHIVIGHGAELVKKNLANLQVNWVEQTQQLGTGHAVQQVGNQISDESIALVLYGDVPLLKIETLQLLLSKINEKTLALLTVNLQNPTGYGRIVRDNFGKVLRIVEEKDATETEKQITEGNTGILAVQGKALKKWLSQLGNNNAQGEYYLTDIIALAVADGFEIATSSPQNEDEVLGVNDKLQLAHLERVYQLQQAQNLMRQGVTLRDPNRFDLRGSLEIGQDVEIDVNVIFEGKNQIGNNVKIGANCLIKNATIGDDVIILANCVIENAEVGANSRIGPFARLRPETVLATDTHIGNFVEIKKSVIGQGSKVNHLSYIGDSLVGKKVNIGAGTITCNYDGANKFQTIIEDGAFIGSDTQLVAPVTVGKNATIGAGSTITKDTPDDQLTLSRSKQLSVPHWQRPVKKEKL
ncbi:MAG: bifunctional UDP-N-acetylglucosamine diphosphorylase/glucosamine-1-phosphate N-acetyltransferase GlmU [Methylococcales bacterium]|nr:bifunctional UDP-N-acetylglucosamine diphosphorylase/glucosamine-1-phosphate N-acetyltransferase GlmU [Methylococcales bacterium]